MRMRLYSCLITVALLCYPYVALGDAHSHRKAAETLLIVMEVEKSLPQMTAQVVEIQVQQNPQLASQREVLQRFLSKYLQLGECQRGHDHRLYPGVHRTGVEEADGVLQDPCGEESQ